MEQQPHMEDKDMRKSLAVFLASLLLIPTLVLAGDTININTADKETLMAIKGVGEKRAEAIIAYREQNGPFKSVDDLAAVQGIGQAIVDANRDLLTVGDGK
jgi:competence protein ComEA